MSDFPDTTRVSVFFYGTFMDAGVLQRNAIDVSHAEPARLLDYELSVRPSVNLHRSTNQIVYGAIAQVSHEDIDRLYARLKNEFDIIYRPFPVSSISHDGTVIPSLCYISEAFADEGPTLTISTNLQNVPNVQAHLNRTWSTSIRS